MAMPVGITKKTKDNSNKLFRLHEEWMQGKKIGRPKQVWVVGPDTFSDGTFTEGHWEKVTR
jgi:hypothetical protein